MELATRIDQTADAFSNAGRGSSENRPFLKFDKGDWMLGQDREEIPAGTQFFPDMPAAEWGYVRWSDGKPVDRRMFLIVRGDPIPTRPSLGETDQSIWPSDDTGRPRDPWQYTIDIPVQEIAGARRDCMLTGAAKGYIGAVKILFKAYGEQLRANTDKSPIIELRGDRYQHPKYGTIRVPSFPLSWKAAGELKKVSKF
jgi:hypothetical protein